MGQIPPPPFYFLCWCYYQHRLWRTARVSQSQPESSKVIQRRSESARVSKILPESARVLGMLWALADFLGPQEGRKEQVMSKTDGKLLVGPQSCLNNDMSVFMRAFQKKSKKILKVKKI